MLSVSGDNGELFAVLSHCVELVGESGLQLLAGDVAQLGLCNERLSLSTDKFLLQNDDLGRVGVLVFQLGDLICDFLFAVPRWLNRGFDVADRFDGDSVLVVSVDELVFELADLVDEDAELVGYI